MPKYSSLNAIREALSALREPDEEAKKNAILRDATLTKPPNSLGRLEEIAAWMASWQGQAIPKLSQPQVAIFAGNHGVAQQGVSAFPSEVTVQMVENFKSGGAAVNQLAAVSNARFSVHPIRLSQPTEDFTLAAAMSESEFVEAFSIGYEAIDAGTDLVIAGEMGIGNTTSAAAIFAANFDGGASKWVGRGTGIDDATLDHKTEVIKKGLRRHEGKRGLESLMTLGGREIVAIAGMIMAARARALPFLLDGFIASAALAALYDENPDITAHVIAGHCSAETAHHAALQKMGLSPLLDLGLRLGEGSGATLAIQIIRSALACHANMASFEEAGVSNA